MNIPLHMLILVSDLVCSLVVVGTKPTIPSNRVSVLLARDMAGGNLFADPKVTS